MKKFILYSIIIAFFLAYNSWETLYTGLYNFVFAFIFILLNFYIFQKILMFVGNFLYGIDVELDRFLIEKEIIKYSHIKKDIIEKTRILPLDYILTAIFGIATSGLVFPIVLSLRFNIVETKRYGKSEEFEVTYSEKIKIIFYSIVLLWMFFAAIKSFNINPILEAYIGYTYRFLTMLTWSMITPFNLLLSYIVVKKCGYDFMHVSPGDIMIFSETGYYKALIIAIMFLPIFGLLLDPIALLLLTIAIMSIVWFREKFKETVG